MNPTISAPVDLEERLRAIERRIDALANHVEPLFDIRSAAEAGTGADLDAMLARVGSIAAELKQREGTKEWDSVDQLAARVMLLTLAQIAVELRRRLIEGDAMLATGRKRLNEVRRALTAFERELSPEKQDTSGDE